MPVSQKYNVFLYKQEVKFVKGKNVGLLGRLLEETRMMVHVSLPGNKVVTV